MSASAASLPLKASRTGDLEEIYAVVQFDIIPAGIDVELVILHRVLDNREVLAVCKLTGNLPGHYILERGISRVDGLN